MGLAVPSPNKPFRWASLAALPLREARERWLLSFILLLVLGFSRVKTGEAKWPVHCDRYELFACVWYVECSPTSKKGVYIPKHGFTKRALPKPNRNPAGHFGHAYSADSSVGTAAWLCLEQSDSHKLRGDPEGGYRLPLSGSAP